MRDAARRVTGAMIGGALGAVAFWVALQLSISLLAAIGAGISVGAGWSASRRSVAWGLVVGIVAPVASVVVAWLILSGASLEALPKILSNIPQSSNAVVSLLTVAGLGIYFGMGRNKRPLADARSNSPLQPTSAPSGARG